MTKTKPTGPKTISVEISGETLKAVKAIARAAVTDMNTVVNVIVAIELRRLKNVQK